MANETRYVEGLREYVRTLEKFGDDVANELKDDVFLPIGQMVAADAQRRVPKRTGRLAATIKPSRTKNKASVKAGGRRAAYAGMIQYGWPRKGIKPNPFLVDAINANKDKALDMMIDGLARLTKKYTSK